jgi:2-phosphosulfolactate phosphatase
MRVNVAALPSHAAAVTGEVTVVVDVIRATTALITLFEAGCMKVYLGPAGSSAEAIATLVPGTPLLCAEGDDGSAPPGFEYQPSPSTLANLDLRGRTAVLATANGTPAAFAAREAGAQIVLLGALRNLSALAARAAQDAARLNGRLTIICSGRLRNTHVALEDLYCAGALIERILVLGNNGPIELDDAARAALGVARGYPDPASALLESATGRHFIDRGQIADVRFASCVDATDIVPALTSDGTHPRWPVEMLMGVPNAALDTRRVAADSVKR